MAAMKLLEEHGYLRIERVTTGKRGRPSERVHVHPEIKNPRNDPTNPTKTPSTPISVGFVGSNRRFSEHQR
jgi:hypothetical protein